MEKALSEKIVIADSGATKTDWCLVQGGEILKRFFTHVSVPSTRPKRRWPKRSGCMSTPVKGAAVSIDRFYGTGCIPEKSAAVSRHYYQSFPIEEIQVYSDLMARTWPLRIRTGHCLYLAPGATPANGTVRHHQTGAATWIYPG